MQSNENTELATDTKLTKLVETFIIGWDRCNGKAENFPPDFFGRVGANIIGFDWLTVLQTTFYFPTFLPGMPPTPPPLYESKWLDIERVVSLFWLPIQQILEEKTILSDQKFCYAELETQSWHLPLANQFPGQTTHIEYSRKANIGSVPPSCT